MKKVYCDHCGKFLFETERENRGGIASDASSKGFVSKLPLFYGTPEFKIFCDKDCCKKWWDEHVSPEQQKEGDDDAKKLREDIESDEFQQGLTDGINTILNMFNKLKK